MDSSGISTEGGIRLHSAHIGNDLILNHARLGQNRVGTSLYGDGITTTGAFRMRDATCAGMVRLTCGNIGRQLDLTRTQLNGMDKVGDSLLGKQLTVGDHFPAKGLSARGRVNLSNSTFAGKVQLDLTTVTGANDSNHLLLDWASFTSFQLNLHGSNIESAQPEIGTAKRTLVSFDGLTYNNRPDGKHEDLQRWLGLLRWHTPTYQPSAYQQLAAVHKAAGHERDAARILIAQQDHRRATVMRPSAATPLHQRAGLWLNRVGMRVFKAATGYGYRPARAAVWLMVLIAAAALLSAMAATTADGITGSPVARRPATNLAPAAPCSSGEIIGLTLRIAVPLITNLSQGSCTINTTSTTGSVFTIVSWFLQALAWILGALVAVAATRSIKRT